eukprot:NP_510444.1 Uncharacterized protein CELE_F33C8.2 [Caenorhabditis elegans]
MDRENTEKLCRRFSILNEFQNKQPAQYAFQKLKNAFPDLQIEEVEYWYKQGTRGFEEVFRNTWYGGSCWPIKLRLRLRLRLKLRLKLSFFPKKVSFRKGLFTRGLTTNGKQKLAKQSENFGNIEVYARIVFCDVPDNDVEGNDQASDDICLGTHFFAFWVSFQIIFAFSTVAHCSQNRKNITYTGECPKILSNYVLPLKIEKISLCLGRNFVEINVSRDGSYETKEFMAFYHVDAKKCKIQKQGEPFQKLSAKNYVDAALDIFQEICDAPKLEVNALRVEVAEQNLPETTRSAFFEKLQKMLWAMYPFNLELRQLKMVEIEEKEIMLILPYIDPNEEFELSIIVKKHERKMDMRRIMNTVHWGNKSSLKTKGVLITCPITHFYNCAKVDATVFALTPQEITDYVKVLSESFWRAFLEIIYNKFWFFF